MRQEIFCLMLLCAASAYAVTTVAAGSLIQHEASYFDLVHKRIRFTPQKAGYTATVQDHKGAIRGRTALDRSHPGFDPKGHSWRIRLAFAFPFGGKRWDELYINLNGNITFGSPETSEYPQRRTWSDGTMRSFAASADLAAAEGKQFMIAPLWGMYSAEQLRIHVTSTKDELIVTWDAERFQAINEGYDPLGRNRFLARLTANGAIEFVYEDIAERDGVVGIFPGPPPEGKQLDATSGATVEDAGSLLRFRSRSTQAIAFTDNEGYIITLDTATHEPYTYCILLKEGQQDGPQDCPVSTTAIARKGSVEFYLPKIGLTTPAAFRWKTGDHPSRAITLKQPRRHGVDLSSARGTHHGNVYEVFHYPFVNKSRFPAFKHIHRTSPGSAELGIILTDFRIDDIHNHGGSNRVQPESRLSAKQLFGSDKLLSATGPVYIGPRFSERRSDTERTYRNYAFAVGWMAHEMVHGWSAYMKWDPQNDPYALLDGSRTHWSDLMHTPVVAPVAHLFTDRPYLEHSVMGGMAVVKNADGTMSGGKSPPLVATGLSALDLYLMGLLQPAEVPDTFFISAEGADVPVRIADVIRHNGPLAGPSARDLKLTVYLLHEDGRPVHRDKLLAARGMEKMLLRYFSAATEGTMNVIAIP